MADLIALGPELGTTGVPPKEPSSFGEDNAGELYLTTWYSDEVYRIDPG